MEHQNAKKLVEKLLKDIKKKGFEAEEIVEGLQELRNFALEVQDPLVTKICRLAYERIQETGEFDVNILEEDMSDEVTPIEYFLQLLKDSERKTNRDELKLFRDVLKGKTINE